MRRSSGLLSALAGIGMLFSLLAAGCGGDGGATNACQERVDAHARSWERCDRDTYESAREIFEDALPCDDAQSHDPGRHAECLAEIEAMDCAAVAAGREPSSCRGVFSD